VDWATAVTVDVEEEEEDDGDDLAEFFVDWVASELELR